MRKTLDDLEREIEQESEKSRSKADEQNIRNLSPEASASLEGEMQILREVVTQEQKTAAELKKKDVASLATPAVGTPLLVAVSGRRVLWSPESVRATILGVIVSLLTVIIATRF